MAKKKSQVLPPGGARPRRYFIHRCPSGSQRARSGGCAPGSCCKSLQWGSRALVRTQRWATSFPPVASESVILSGSCRVRLLCRPGSSFPPGAVGSPEARRRRGTGCCQPTGTGRRNPPWSLPSLSLPHTTSASQRSPLGCPGRQRELLLQVHTSAEPFLIEKINTILCIASL